MGIRTFLITSVAVLVAVPALAETPADPEARAAAVEAQMTEAERVILTHGMIAMPFSADAPPLPKDAIAGAGYIEGIARLGVPALRETDASLGVSYLGNIRGDGGATPLPSGLAMGSTWNPALMRQGGVMIGGEAKAKGFNVLLAGGANLVRDPRNGRAFEYFSEDPLLTGVLAGEAIAGVQSNNIISTIKHFAVNGQETGRKFVDSRISDANARESDLFAFQIAIERGRPGSVMCAYNKVNGAQACDSDYLLNKVLKQDWRYRGFVMSDWGAVPGVSAALNGLDQQSGYQLDPKLFFGDDLKAAAAKDPAYAARLRDMNRRILYAIYANGLDRHPPVKRPIDAKAALDVAEAVAKEGIVLLRNARNVLPLAADARRIAVIGGYADTGVLSGGGSSQVQMNGGAAATVPLGGDAPYAAFMGEAYHRSNPLKAIKAKAPDAAITFRRGNYITDAVIAAKTAEVAIVFATQWQTEGFDQPDLSLPGGQDALIAAVASANPNTIVVLETGGPVLMPWLDKTAAVIQAWYPGGRGGEAIASVLFGETNPSGRLPVTFPASLDDLPRPKLDGSDTIEPDMFGNGQPGDKLSVDYDIEGSDVGYRWNAREGKKALFPFGFGLSYTSFAHAGFKMNGTRASFTVANTGKRAGADVAQLYLVSAAGEKKQRLVGFHKVNLAPGAKQKVSLGIDPRLLAEWENGGWTIKGGTYQFALGSDAERLGAPVSVELPARSWKD
ncbi:MAG TPA: glycoside hydrolase family 3 C-terminal domain-containing protein [Sphingobium sp.]|nr:glycoside hydrolase family 3 C-terminal domain-containing protein [Sphingobium sp.]